MHFSFRNIVTELSKSSGSCCGSDPQCWIALSRGFLPALPEGKSSPKFNNDLACVSGSFFSSFCTSSVHFSPDLLKDSTCNFSPPYFKHTFSFFQLCNRVAYIKARFCKPLCTEVTLICCVVASFTLSCLCPATQTARNGICKPLRRPGIDSNESIPGFLCSLGGRYDNPIPTRFLALIDCSKIPALD